MSFAAPLRVASVVGGVVCCSGRASVGYEAKRAMPMRTCVADADRGETTTGATGAGKDCEGDVVDDDDDDDDTDDDDDLDIGCAKRGLVAAA